jgi:apolipoprotein D and lipocalin family protein
MSLHASRSLLLLAGLALLAGCATTTERLHLPPLRPVESVDLQRYLGTWYEIARYPQSFQAGCTGTTATYSMLPDGDIDVFNQCRVGSLDGPLKEAHGRARVAKGRGPSELEVSFFRPFWADYWVIDLDSAYAYAVVGHPGRDYLWILSRTPTLPDATYAAILERLRAQGYDLVRLERTLQRGG